MISVDCGAPCRDPFAHEAVSPSNSYRLLCASLDSLVPQYVPDGRLGAAVNVRRRTDLL